MVVGGILLRRGGKVDGVGVMGMGMGMGMIRRGVYCVDGLRMGFFHIWRNLGIGEFGDQANRFTRPEKKKKLGTQVQAGKVVGKVVVVTIADIRKGSENDAQKMISDVVFLLFL